MKNYVLIVLAFIVFPVSIIAQSPNSFNYQAVIRDNSNELLTNQNVGLRVSILDGSSSGAVLYSETHSETTNAYGIINLKIGDGTYLSGNFSSIEWGADEKFLKIEIDESGGSSYTNLGAVQLLSVPYALFANSASNLGAENIYSPLTDTLFVVKDHDGNVVFAVFPDGAAVYVNETAKGKVGGFAVSGRSPSKVNEEDYLIVTADSTRVYVNEASAAKGKVGGFAVSGRSPSKGNVSSLMDLTKENYFIGHDAGMNNTDGLYNTFFGYNSGYENTIGYKNIFLGYKSGFSNLEGNANIFIGDSAGIFNESGWHNIFVGTMAGSDNIDGAKNICIGSYAGQGLVSGWNNLIIGEYAGAENTTGNSNIFMGNYSGLSNTEGSTNIFIGKLSGRNNTVGTNNIFMGLASGKLNINGSENIFIGVLSGYSNTTAENNIFLGNSSGYSNETGSENIFIGKESGFSNIDGTLNVCIGFQSGYSLTSGNYNSYLGFWAGRGNTTGTYNTFIGAQAGMYNTESINNVFIGSYVAAEDTIGSENTYVGAAAGRYSTGNNNTFIGSICAESVLNSHHNVYVGGFTGRKNLEGNFNVFLGHSTGYWNDGSYNTFIGHAAGADSKGSNNIFIGYIAGKFNKTSNKLYIENSDADSTGALIWGDFENNLLRLNGSVGINTQPLYELSIADTISSAMFSLKGAGDTYSYSRIAFMSDEAVDKRWDIYHNKSNNFEFVYNDGTWHNGLLTLQNNGDLIIAGSIYPTTDNFSQLGSASLTWKEIWTVDGAIQSSDERLKVNITDLNYGLKEILELRPVSFKWKNNLETSTKLGLIAQEVQPVISEVVKIGDDDNKTLGIIYTDLVPILIKGMQEQQQIIEDQKSKILSLEARLTEIEKLLLTK